MIEHMEVVAFISCGNLFFQELHMHQSPTIQLQHILKFNFIGFIIEIVGVAQDIANGVADLAVNLRELFQYLFGDTDISLVVGGSCPQTNDIGAIWAITSCGATVLPTDLDILRPSPSTT